MPFLRDFLAVRLEDALFEHAGGEDGEHAFAFFEFLLFGHDLVEMGWDEVKLVMSCMGVEWENEGRGRVWCI